MHASVVHREDIRMIELPGRPRFLLETPQPVGVSGISDRQRFDSHFAVQPRVPSAIDLAHTAFAEQRQNLIVTHVTVHR